MHLTWLYAKFTYVTYIWLSLRGCNYDKFYKSTINTYRTYSATLTPTPALVYIYIYIRITTNEQYTYIYMCSTYIIIFVYMYVRIHVCVYIYIYIYIHTYMYTINMLICIICMCIPPGSRYGLISRVAASSQNRDDLARRSLRNFFRKRSARAGLSENAFPQIRHVYEKF